MQQAVLKQGKEDLDLDEADGEEWYQKQFLTPGAYQELNRLELLYKLRSRAAKRKEQLWTSASWRAFQQREEKDRIVHALSLGSFKQRLYSTINVRGYFPTSPSHISRFLTEHDSLFREYEIEVTAQQFVDYFSHERRRMAVIESENTVIIMARALGVPRLALQHGLGDYCELTSFMASMSECMQK